MARDKEKASEWRKARYSAHKEQECKSNKDWHKNNPEKSRAYYAARSAKTEKELLKLNHYTNFRPRWAVDNLAKGDKQNEQLSLLAA